MEIEKIVEIDNNNIAINSEKMEYNEVIFQERAKTLIYGAVSEEVNNISGAYLKCCRIEKCGKGAEDEVAAAKLWDKSSQYLELDQELPPEYIIQCERFKPYNV